MRMNDNQFLQDILYPGDVSALRAYVLAEKSRPSRDPWFLNTLSSKIVRLATEKDLYAPMETCLCMLDALVELGADLSVDQAEKECRLEQCRLNRAVVSGSLALVKYLIEHGALIDAPDTLGANQGKTPLASAIQHGHRKIAAYLIEQGARVRMPDGQGSGPLFAAIEAVSPSMVRVVLAAGANVHTINGHGRRALDEVVSAMGHPVKSHVLKMALHLLDAGADPDLPPAGGKSARVRANEQHPLLAHLFESYQANKEARLLQTIVPPALGSSPRRSL